MSRRDREQAAAQAASEAGRILQAQRQAPKDEPSSLDPAPQPQDVADKPLPSPRNEQRQKALEEMWQRDAERKGIVEAAPVPEPDPVAQVPEPVPPTPEQMLDGGKFSEVPPVEETPAATPEPEATPTIEYVRVKVDGEEFDAPKAEVEEAGGVKAYQRDKASERRLAKANEALAEAKRMQAAVATYVQQQRPVEPQKTNDEFIAERMDAIRYGTPAEAAKALTEIQQRSAAPVVDQNAVINEAVTRMNYLSGVKQFTNEFKDLVEDTDLMMIIQAKAQAGITAMQGDKSGVDWTEFYRKIGNELRIKFNRPNQPVTDPAAKLTGNPSQVSTDREARKASIVNLPTAATRAEVPKEQKPETRADILADMRKARGFQNG